jgi:hypothetical protein
MDRSKSILNSSWYFVLKVASNVKTDMAAHSQKGVRSLLRERAFQEAMPVVRAG